MLGAVARTADRRRSKEQELGAGGRSRSLEQELVAGTRSRSGSLELKLNDF